jgi:tryptophan synthase alpha chain
VDGLIVVDLPPEEAEELAGPARANGIDFIVLTAPTTDDSRLPVVLAQASGFVYYVSITGITGTASASGEAIAAAMARLRRMTALPLAVGFGLKTAAQVAAVAAVADAAVVGSAIVQCLAEGLTADGAATPGLVRRVLALVGELAKGVRG